MMRPGLVLALTLVLGIPTAYGTDATDFEVKTTRDLVNLCSVASGDATHDAAMGYCLGFVDAAHDYHAAITSGELLKPIACPEPTTTRQQVVEVFVDWARSNDGLLDNESPIHGLMRAVSARWPC